MIAHNVRNADYRSETDYTVRLKDRTLDLSRRRFLDLFLWGLPTLGPLCRCLARREGLNRTHPPAPAAAPARPTGCAFMNNGG